MKEIRIGQGGQLALLLGVVAVLAAVILAQAPEIQRYLKIRQM